ncbi:Carboxyl-terminal proteinase [Venustampulla echinocandica]|uniref:Carboxyl-terminal proteinase n=1 Tax=Venustampulla echinocandica TaxID=2656787 RepID=A0A370TKB3_9HELO|nr:Carboxyl-terminal proteinase [Venustampulla echinocandica]RDL35961.1 Carboxyl-terminal proteinase [Venustampulla echinocandica]
MSSPPLRDLLLLFLFSTFFVCGASKPTSYPNKNGEQAKHKRASLNVLKTTVTDTQTIDWISLDSQGEIAQAPPPRTPRNTPRPLAELELPGAELGPPGTVPVSRADPDYLAKASAKELPGTQSLKRQSSNAGVHWYVSSNQTVDNIGGSCVFSLFAPFTERTADFSLLQTAVTRQNVLWTGGRGPPTPITQTVEAGWINFIDQVAQPHLFTFYTTNGYIRDGDNQGGWNTEHTGWVQVDPTIHPGSVFTPLSTDGGAQNNLKIEYALFQDHWWLGVEDRWIGYYPASLFSSISSDPASTTLAGGSDSIHYYGEVFNSEETLTTTDMGSGQFANTGYGHAGYILNMTYTNTNNVSTPYNAVFTDTDVTRYTHEAHLLSGTDMGSYAFIGGPGAGGVVGG